MLSESLNMIAELFVFILFASILIEYFKKNIIDKYGSNYKD